jgi:hypothetical protein
LKRGNLGNSGRVAACRDQMYKNQKFILGILNLFLVQLHDVSSSESRSKSETIQSKLIRVPEREKYLVRFEEILSLFPLYSSEF